MHQNLGFENIFLELKSKLPKNKKIKIAINPIAVL
jgi:hypothetical protein